METGKSEITNLPEGMSSEELDKLTTGEDVEQVEDTELAQEALDATDEKSSPAEESVDTDETDTEEKTSEEEDKSKTEADTKVKVDPKDAVIGEKRRENRELALENARLEGQLEARKELQTTKDETSVPKSPLEIAEAAWLADPDNVDSLDGFAMNGDLYRKQRTFDKEQDAKETAIRDKKQSDNTLNQAVETLQTGDLSVAKTGQGLDLQSVSAIGEKHLTKGDMVDIKDIAESRGKTAAIKEAYKIMVRRTIAAGGEDAKLIKNAINTKSKSKSQTKPEKTKEKLDIDALTTEGDDTDTGEAETDTQSQRLANFVCSSDD